MNARQLRRLSFVLLLLLASIVIVGLILFALKQNINLFFTPSQIMKGEAPVQTRIRVGGMVEKGSVVRGENLNLHFKMTDYAETIIIQYRGILPDLFREGQGIVALGRMQSKDIFVADEILAKHDENYMPPEIAQGLKKIQDNTIPEIVQQQKEAKTP